MGGRRKTFKHVNGKEVGGYVVADVLPIIFFSVMDTSEDRLSAFAADVMSFPVGDEVYLCSSWIEGEDPDLEEAGARTEITPELALHHTHSDFSEDGEEKIVAAGYKQGDRWMIRVREMAARPDRPTKLIAKIVEAISDRYPEDLRYTFSTHHFNDFDLYVAHARPQRI